jgi:hyperosmotically inducible periplasmic protein
MAFLPIFLAGLAGAFMMFFMDPQTGNRRRALLRDKAVKLKNKTSEYTEVIAERTGNKAKGTAAELSKRLQQDDYTDQNLVEQIRSELVHYVSHPDAVFISSDKGKVSLSGRILTAELPSLLERIRAMNGVHRVDNALVAYDNAEDISNFQGRNPIR